MSNQLNQSESEEDFRRAIPLDVKSNVLAAIGQTPVIQFHRYLDNKAVDLFIKAEGLNPGGSAKDRPARLMIEDALSNGMLRKGQTVIESSSGNMGIGLAQACRYHGLKLICVVDPNAQAQNVGLIRALGGEIELVSDPIDGDFLTARLARVAQLISKHRGSFWPNQYANLVNPKSHELGTAAELDDLFDGELDFVFVATSSTGTAQGIQNLFRERDRDTQVVAVDATGSKLFNGTLGVRKIPGMGAGLVPPLAKGVSFDGVIRMSDIRCVAGCRRAAEREAFLPGGSGGGVLEAIRSVQDELTGARVAAVIHDSGARYLETIYNDDWVNNALGCSLPILERMISSPAI